MNWNIVKKEIKENFFAMKGVLWLFVVAVLFSGMTYSFITVKELSLLAQTEVMITMGKMILGVSLLISIILASVSFSNEKEQSTIESLMLTPISGIQLANGKLIGTMFMWLMIFLVSLPYMMTLSSGTGIGYLVILFILITGTAMIFIYSNISISLSIIMGSSKNAMITSILVFLITAIPSFLSTTMKKAGFGMILDGISPLSNTINLMKGVIINRQGLLSLSQYIIPIILYVILSYFLLVVAVKKFNFEGGE
ncbi:ABC transporter permease subunit [Clostridium grantii]|uniref:ABC-2 type transport system permease protein n=1 Tax=Clostridium grantii DSM 8605 TaxID=1121316 RepID=A0A1M5WX41_9CLOT|nr:ABC transporter permease subunit [Clostridium grantii]SHH92226.1 ABC-2 type transport system permease protein [Clostridium grantii DSM 8605]